MCIRDSLGFVQRIENFDAERDTIVRLGYTENNISATYRIRPTEGKITQHNISVENIYYTNSDWSFNELSSELSYSINFRNTADVSVSFNHNEIDLLFPFSFVADGAPLPRQRYSFNSISASYSSDERKLVSYEVGAQTGSFYNGTLSRANADLNFRVQPWGNWSFGYQWNKLDFPETFGNEIITAFLSTLEIGFNRNLLWTTLFQYVQQNDFVGINSRLQWRFSPQSDVFLVFVDNYDVFNGVPRFNNLRSNNRALILKVNYWY